MRQKYLILLCLIILSMMAFYYFSSDTLKQKAELITKYDNTIKIEQDKLNSAKVLNEQLKEVSKVITQSMSTTREFTPEETNEFIKKLATLADQYQIGVNSLYPKVVSTSNKNLIEQQYTLVLNCTFIQMGQFISQLESFDNIIKIKTLDVSPINVEKQVGANADTVTRYQVTIELSTFKIVKEA
ncbi:MAG TPA: hypothetical protein PLD62_05200 [Candidatus Cloacimonadota bacterium]|nr:hypothetical protein [Candidatus Cloacimonadota bacterium]